MEIQNLRLGPAARLLVFLASLFLCAFIGSILVAFIVNGGINTQSMRIATVVQDCVIFILPAIITAIVVAPLPAKFLGVDSKFSIPQLLLAICAMIAAMPIINYIVEINESIVFPESLSGLEQWMREQEENAKKSVEILLGGDSIGSLIVDILIVGVLAGMSEELLFRGTIQRLFIASRVNNHLSIWITAFIFSAIHMQFFGFFPRLLLGAYFGYLFYWSKSLWLPVIIHALNNSIVIYSTWLESDSADPGKTQLDKWGIDSPTLLIASAIVTSIIIIKMRKLSVKKQ